MARGSGTSRVGATRSGGAAGEIAAEALGLMFWLAVAGCHSRDNAAGGRDEACATTSST